MQLLKQVIYESCLHVSLCLLVRRNNILRVALFSDDDMFLGIVSFMLHYVKPAIERLTDLPHQITNLHKILKYHYLSTYFITLFVSNVRMC